METGCGGRSKLVVAECRPQRPSVDVVALFSPHILPQERRFLWSRILQGGWSCFSYFEICCILVADTLLCRPVGAQSEALVCGHSLASNEGSNPAGGMGICLL